MKSSSWSPSFARSFVDRRRTSAATALLALAATAAPAAGPPVPDTMAQRVMACNVCHGKEGRATPDGYFPRIAGKPAGYLYQQLLNFRDGRRRHAAMAGLLEHLPDAYLGEIAAHFGGLDLPYPPPQRGAAAAPVLAQGEALVRHGDAQRRLPACVACHGAAMTGVAPALPGLLGLPRDYLIGQLGAWRTGERRAQAPDCMAQIARALTPADVGAIASWLSAQPVPDQGRPGAALAAPAPLDCGSGIR